MLYSQGRDTRFGKNKKKGKLQTLFVKQSNKRLKYLKLKEKSFKINKKDNGAGGIFAAKAAGMFASSSALSIVSALRCS